MKRQNRLSWIAALVLWVSLGSSLYAQLRSRDVSGVVMDRQHEPLKGAIVQVHNLDSLEVISYITGHDGHYAFKRLSGNCDYKISATWRNQRSPSETLSIFDSDKPRIINLTVKNNGQE